MKNLYSKSKGKIHPSPSPQPSAAAINGGGGGDALAVLKLLPAAIFALTAALAFEDKEVVAYLMLRSMEGSAAEERRRCRRIAGVHLPLFDCGCFECYTSFWSRWDCSKDRDVIHMAIEAFEEHLASKERRKGKEKRKRKKDKKEKEREDEEAVMVEAEESKGSEEGAVSGSDRCFAFAADVAKEEGEEEEEEEKEGEGVVEIPAASGGERRRGWADVVGMFNSRLWSLWSPEV